MKTKILIPAVLVLFVLSALLAATTSCSGEVESGGRIGVIVTILPQAEFLEMVGGERVDVTVMVPPGASPHTYEPTPGQMTKVARAEMYAKVGSGVEFELAWMDKIAALNNDMLIVDCSKRVSLIEIAPSDGHEHDSGQEGHEHEGGTDPHIWMSPANVKIMVNNICDGLIEIDPDNRAYYEANRDSYLQDLAELDQDIRESLSTTINRVFMVFHPSFGYFAEEYGLKMLPIEAEGKEPTASGLSRLIDQAKEQDVKVVFAEPQFNPASAGVIAGAIGGTVVFIDPLAGDYISNMRNLTEELVLAME